jgi:hypothetical protein
MFKKKTKINFEKYKTDVPIIKFSLTDDSVYFAIVDTGSESTVMDEKFVKDNSELFQIASRHTMSLIGVSGDSVHTVEHVSSTFILENRRCLISGITSDLSELNKNACAFCDSAIQISVIIGCDTLKQFSSIIDFNENAIKVKL